MKRKILMLVVAIATLAIVMSMGVGSVMAAETTSYENVAYYLGDNLFPSIGFENMLEGEETQYALSTVQRSGVGSLSGDSAAWAVKDGDNTYIELGYHENGKSFSSFFAMVNFKANGIGKYYVSIDLKQGGTAYDTNNLGWRFAVSSMDVQINGLWDEMQTLSNGWKRYSTVIEVDTALMANLDSFSIWFNSKSLDREISHICVDNVVISKIEAVPMGDNLFPSVGFENMLEGEETQYALSTVQRSGVGSLSGDSAAWAVKDGDNTYIELGYHENGKSFSSFFAMVNFKANGIGKYYVSIDLKQGGTAYDTNNLGWRFAVSSMDVQINGLWDEMQYLGNGWCRYSTIVEVDSTLMASLDSFSIWFNTKSLDREVSHICVDNVVVAKVALESTAPVLTIDTFNWDEAVGGDVEIEVDVKEQAIVSLVKTDTNEELIADLDYTFTNNILTVKADYIELLDEKIHTFRLTTVGGEAMFSISVLKEQQAIPDPDGYRMDSTLRGGDFESYEIGLKFSETQTEEAWGSLSSYDDVGEIVDDAGNHVLRIQATENTTKTYASAFAMTSPDISLGDIVTLEFDYRFTANDIASYANNGQVNVSFVGASNNSYHTILLNNTYPTKTVGAASHTWDIAYSQIDGDYTHVSMTFIVDFAFLNATNSLRFLLMHNGDTSAALNIDNVEIIRWVDPELEDAEKPVITEETVTFDGANPADIVLNVDLKDYNVSSIAVDGTVIKTEFFSVGSDYTQITLTKEFLAMLENKEYVIKLTTLGGEDTVTLVVINNEEEQEPNPTPSGCDCASAEPTAAIIGSLSTLFMGMAALVVFRKKH